MKSAKEMKQISDKHYLERYEGYINEIEGLIWEVAERGFYHLKWLLVKSECKDWTRSPLFDYFEGLKEIGYQIEPSENENYFEFEISWRG